MQSPWPRRVLNFVGREPFELDGGLSIPCTCSIGWAVFPWYENAAEAVPYTEVLRLADSALYQAKKAGRNQAVGLLPTGKEAGCGSEEHGGGKHSRLAEQLSARTVTTPGPSSQGGFAEGRIQSKRFPQPRKSDFAAFVENANPATDLHRHGFLKRRTPTVRYIVRWAAPLEIYPLNLSNMDVALRNQGRSRLRW